jgi:hypothetical protein
MLITMMTCIGPAEAVKSMYQHHVESSPWQVHTISVLLMLVTTFNSLRRLHRAGALSNIASAAATFLSNAWSTLVPPMAAVTGVVDGMLRSVDSFMVKVRERRQQALEAYYAATTMLVMTLLVAMMIVGAPAAWCAAFPMSAALAALLLVQQRPTTVSSKVVPGSRLVLMLQATLTLGWAAGVVPTAAVMAPLPAVAVYIAAAAAVSKKLRPRRLCAGFFHSNSDGGVGTHRVHGT